MRPSTSFSMFVTSCNRATLTLCLVFINFNARLSAQEPAEVNLNSTLDSSSRVNQGPLQDNWAQEFLGDDPLLTSQSVTLDDIRQGLADAHRRDTVITRHFHRITDATHEEKLEFLSDLARAKDISVQRQAVDALQVMGELESVVRSVLLEYLSSEDLELRRAAVVGLERIALQVDHQTDSYWLALLEGLGAENETVSRSAARQLKAEGLNSIPVLLNALREGHPNTILAAQLLSEIVGTKPIGETASPATSIHLMAKEHTGDNTVGKSAKLVESQHSVRSLDLSKPTSVTVYYGTNREVVGRQPFSWQQLFSYPAGAILLLLATVPFVRRGRAKGEHDPRGCMHWILPTLLLAGAIWSIWMFQSELQTMWRLGTGPIYGPRRDAAEVVHFGACTVSLPPGHQVGSVERPALGPENEEKHVVLKETQELEQQAFFNLLRSKIAELPDKDRSCFVFIHGFNVDFESAAQRTAQIHYDLKFEGVPIFFSWPSRASVRHYFSDRNEIEFSRYLIKQFLIDVAEKVHANRIHVIAHSMGADATCRAIAELGDRGKIFDQIILAAPDIDREVFRLQLAPRLTQTANRTTLYCSKNDFALLISRNFNDSTRAGDSSRGALVLRELDTVDASDIDTDLLGHSYYGDCLPLLDDVNKLLSSSLSPLERHLLPWPVDDSLTFWTLPENNDNPIQQ